MMKIPSQTSAKVSFTENSKTASPGVTGQDRTLQSRQKLREQSEGRQISRSHVRSNDAANRLLNIKAPSRHSSPKPPPKTQVGPSQAFMQKIAAEKPPTLGLNEFEVQFTSFVKLPTTKIDNLLAALNQSGGPKVTIDHLRSFRHCMQQSGRTGGEAVQQQAKEFALAFLSLPVNDRGARTNFTFDGVLTTYALDIAQGKF